MPRPGPRPYECVRRAWHSDIHKPIRGSIIHQILRFVYERHSTATKKNREWQVKLPIVVLRAEEIMYSKANSEAEYADPDTLWDRVNDAISTIIRRDESSETGQHLPPCVEAALNLGCVAEKPTRSQRNSNPRNYLSPRPQQPQHPVPPTHFSGSSNEHNSNLMPPQFVSQPTFGRPECGNINKPNASLAAFSQIVRAESNASLNLGSVFPLYYGTNFQPEVAQLGFQELQSNVIVGRPVYPSNAEPAQIDRFPSLFHSSLDQHAQDAAASDRRGRPRVECDLSLRLGMSSDHGHGLLCGKASSASGCHKVMPHDDSRARGKFTGKPTIQGREACFLRAEPATHLSVMHESWRNREGKVQKVESFLRKRKMPFHENGDDGQIFW
ncbi:uncharacterized protein LOC116012559 [Ipomoea triloba]|uniref:uncharacterized protein LOC116012559 n=1 Tax=Ipomoea triloba TaxID=35885 RepID=UPI00125D416E|nr:uncharacterized protein LOC116012559 [Ipomoea triloba]